MTMFNILLIVAGILEYILLGVNFKVHRSRFHCYLGRLTSVLKDNFANTYLGGILIGVAFLNAFIEFYQLQKSEAILASFLAMIPPSSRVVRDGALITVPAADLVKGDIVLVVSSATLALAITPSSKRIYSAPEIRLPQIWSCSRPPTSRLTTAVSPESRSRRSVSHVPMALNIVR